MTLANRIIGIGLIIFSIYVWLAANAFPSQNTIGPGAEFFPKLTAVILAILSVFLLFKKENSEQSVFTLQRKNVPYFIGSFISLIIYVILIPTLGFVISTILLTFIWMWLMGIRKWIALIITSILVAICVSAIFEFLLNVPIPHGILY